MTELSALRELLLDKERQKLHEIEALLDEVRARAGSEEAFAETLNSVLLEALKQVQRTDPKGLTRTLSPSVVTSIKREIVNSRDDMVEALYPITGRMVSAAVQNAIQNLADDINRKFDSALSPQLVVAKLKSVATGKPLSDFTLAGSADGSITQILLIEKASGVSVSHWHKDDGQQTNKDMVSGLLSALSTFANETYSNDSNTELRTIDLNGTKIAMRHSARHILAVEFDGSLSGEQRQLIDNSFVQVIENLEFDADEDSNRQLKELALEVESYREEKAASKKGLIIVGLLLAGLLGYIGWVSYLSQRFENRINLVDQYARQAPNLVGFPLHVTGNARSDTITVAGGIPIQFDQIELKSGIDNLQLGDTQVVLELSRLQTSESSAAELNNTRQQLSTLKDEFNKAFENSFAELETLNSQLGKFSTQVEQLEMKQANNSNEFASLINQTQKDAQSALGKLSTVLEQTSEATTNAASTNESKITALSSQTATTQSDLKELKSTLNSLFQRIQDSNEALSNAIESNNVKLSERVAENKKLLEQYQAADQQRIISTIIHFNAGVELKEQALSASVLDDIAKTMLRYPNRLRVVGYSDNSGSKATNASISLLRAEKVRDTLVQLGIDADRLTAIGRGSDNQIYTATENLDLNRRVEFEWLK
ncbi:MAG: OmpA family protein [Pseudomonadota bacterium]